jgi:hypothetical protein
MNCSSATNQKDDPKEEIASYQGEEGNTNKAWQLRHNQCLNAYYFVCILETGTPMTIYVCLSWTYYVCDGPVM